MTARSTERRTFEFMAPPMGVDLWPAMVVEKGICRVSVCWGQRNAGVAGGRDRRGEIQRSGCAVRDQLGQREPGARARSASPTGRGRSRRRRLARRARGRSAAGRRRSRGDNRPGGARSAPRQPGDTRPAAPARTAHPASLTSTPSGESGSGLEIGHAADVDVAVGPRHDLGLQRAAVGQAVVHEERVRGHVRRGERHAVALEPVDARQRERRATRPVHGPIASTIGVGRRAPRRPP